MKCFPLLTKEFLLFSDWFFFILINSLYLHPHCEVEQLVARRAHNPKVVGSSPALATSNPDGIRQGFFVLRIELSLLMRK